MPKSKKASTLHELFLNKLRALYDVEMQIVKALPKLAKKADDAELMAGFEKHLQETKQHVKRLEKCFKLLKAPARKLQSDAIRGLEKDASWVMKNVKAGPALDANLIAAAQYVEHYEIAGYGTAITWAELMGHTNVAEILKETLAEEEATDKKLNNLAEGKINERVEMGM